MKLLGSSVLLEVLALTLRWLVVTEVSGQSVGPIFKVQAVRENFFDCQLPPTSQRCVTSQKNEDLNNAAAEA
jgi:hypothetical protein